MVIFSVSVTVGRSCTGWDGESTRLFRVCRRVCGLPPHKGCSIPFRPYAAYRATVREATVCCDAHTVARSALQPAVAGLPAPQHSFRVADSIPINGFTIPVSKAVRSPFGADGCRIRAMNASAGWSRSRRGRCPHKRPRRLSARTSTRLSSRRDRGRGSPQKFLCLLLDNGIHHRLEWRIASDTSAIIFVIPATRRA